MSRKVVLKLKIVYFDRQVIQLIKRKDKRCKNFKSLKIIEAGSQTLQIKNNTMSTYLCQYLMLDLNGVLLSKTVDSYLSMKILPNNGDKVDSIANPSTCEKKIILKLKIILLKTYFNQFCTVTRVKLWFNLIAILHHQHSLWQEYL